MFASQGGNRLGCRLVGRGQERECGEEIGCVKTCDELVRGVDAAIAVKIVRILGTHHVVCCRMGHVARRGTFLLPKLE